MSGFVINAVYSEQALLEIEARSTATSGGCPNCLHIYMVGISAIRRNFPVWRSTSFQMRFEQLKRSRPRYEDLVLVHGDSCFPNILLDSKSLAVNGFVDWGHSGIADRYQDLALAARSI